jgi:hypothetical protein
MCRRVWVTKAMLLRGRSPRSLSSPVILEPVFVSAHNNETMCEVAKSENSSVQEVPVCDVSQDL